MTDKTKKWSEQSVQTLLDIVGSESPVSAEKVEQAAAALEVSTRSVASKLRQLDREVASLAKVKVSRFSDQEAAALSRFVQQNEGTMTYKQISEVFLEGKFSAKEIQGKILSMELTGMVKPADKVEAAKAYSEQEEAVFVKMAEAGKYIEDIAEALGKTIASVRGKALSLTRSGQISKIPAQKASHSNAQPDPVAQLGDKIGTMTVSQIAQAVDKTERGIKTMLTRRGITVADYDGAAKKAKAEAKSAD